MCIRDRYYAYCAYGCGTEYWRSNLYKCFAGDVYKRQGCSIVKGPLKWALLGATIFSILLSWGKNFMGLTDFLSLIHICKLRSVTKQVTYNLYDAIPISRSIHVRIYVCLLYTSAGVPSKGSEIIERFSFVL